MEKYIESHEIKKLGMYREIKEKKSTDKYKDYNLMQLCKELKSVVGVRIKENILLHIYFQPFGFL